MRLQAIGNEKLPPPEQRTVRPPDDPSNIQKMAVSNPLLHALKLSAHPSLSPSERVALLGIMADPSSTNRQLAELCSVSIRTVKRTRAKLRTIEQLKVAA